MVKKLKRKKGGNFLKNGIVQRSSRFEVTLFWNRSDLSMFLDSRRD